jgi:hypothetical protein
MINPKKSEERKRIQIFFQNLVDDLETAFILANRS